MENDKRSELMETADKLISERLIPTQDDPVMGLTADDHVVLILNLHAGTLSEGTAILEIIDALSSLGTKLEVYQTLYIGHAKMLAAKHGLSADLIICAGGDGTLNEVANGLMTLQSPPPLAYIPAGTTCDFARTIRLPLEDYRAAANLAMHGRPVGLDIGLMNTSDYFVYVASFGAFTSVASQTPRKLKKQWGHIAYVVEGLKSLANIKPIRVQIELDDAVFEEELLFASISNATSIGGLLRISENEVFMDDGKFEVMMVKNHSNPLETASLISSLVDQNYRDKNIIFFSTNHIKFRFETPQAWTLDGEQAGEHEFVEIRNMRRALKVVIPTSV